MLVFVKDCSLFSNLQNAILYNIFEEIKVTFHLALNTSEMVKQILFNFSVFCVLIAYFVFYKFQHNQITISYGKHEATIICMGWAFVLFEAYENLNKKYIGKTFW